MGNQVSTTSKNFKDAQLYQFEDIVQLLISGDYPSFGEIKIYQRQDKSENNLLALKTRSLSDNELFLQMGQKCEERLEISHDNIIQLLGYQLIKNKEICGQLYKCELFFEFFQHDLEQEINRRHNRQDFFKQSELWYLAESLISACNCFQQKGIFHGDLQPKNILLTNSGQVKIADHELIHPYKNGYIKTLIGQDQAFLSPNQMFYFRLKSYQPVHDMCKSDVWALGLTLLECATLSLSSIYYDWKNSEINYNLIEDRINKVSQVYSNEFTQLITKMLDKDEGRRPDFLYLNTYYIQSFENKIAINK